MKKRVAILGATGSIGKSALDVVAREKDSFDVVLLSAHGNAAALEQAGAFWPGARKVLSGEAGGREKLLDAVAGCGADIALNGICGAAGLEPSMAAIEAGCNLALANKETLVMAGPLVTRRAEEIKITIIPVDSEHSAIFHLLKQTAGSAQLDEILLTASGGPFRNYSLAQMQEVKAQEALAHPTWNMGAKISVDSATMANKGLEVIEAARLFGIQSEKIKVLVHPQSIAHSMIRMRDGAVYAQLSLPDMRLPVSKALHWPETGGSDFGRLNFDGLSLDFHAPDAERFPMLPLAYEALEKGALYPCAYNAANEAAAAAFLAGRIGFLDIVSITRYVIERDWSAEPQDIDSVLEADRQAKAIAEKVISEKRKE